MRKFEDEFWNLRHEYKQQLKDEPNNTILKRIDTDLWRLFETYEREKREEKDNNKQSVKSLLNNIIRALHDDNNYD